MADDLRTAAIEVVDPFSGSAASLSVWEPHSAQFAARLKKVFKERRKWAKRNGIACYRVYDADLPDYAVAIDFFEGAGDSTGDRFAVVAEYQAPKTVDSVRAAHRFDDVLAIVPCALGVPGDRVYARRRMQEKGGGQYAREERSSSIACTQEAGNLLELDFTSYLDTGIFLDHRLTREMVGHLASGKRFLNLFAYTGTATVHAACQGARATTTVDLSQTYLAWARRNMALNGFIGPEHSYIRADATAWILHEAAGPRRYDAIFVDPPTFSNSKAMGQRTWSVQRDHAKLLAAVGRLLAPGGIAVFSCNLRSFKIDSEALAASHLAVRDITAETIPHDFARNPRIHRCYLLARQVDAAQLDEVRIPREK